MTCTHTSTLGVYLLGALEPEDRSGFEAHLSRCDLCRAELVRLAPLPGLLNQITLADFDDAGGPPTLPSLAPEPIAVTDPPEPAVVADPPAPVVVDLPPARPVRELERPRPRRPYWMIAAAAALVVALTVGGIVAYETLRGPVTGPSEVTWSASNPRNGVRADARMIERAWGTEIQIMMDNVPAGESCRLVVWAKGANGYRETAGWWATPAEHPEGEIPASTSIDLSMIYKLEVVAADTTLLVDIHRPS